MGLDALLAAMERRAADTPDTPCNRGEVTAKPVPIKACTLDTSDTPEKTIAPVDEAAMLPCNAYREVRRQKVIAMLEATPGTQRAIHADTDSDPHNVIMAVAVRACQQTCEMLIPKAKYDPWRLLELIERHGQTTH